MRNCFIALVCLAAIACKSPSQGGKNNLNSQTESANPASQRPPVAPVSAPTAPKPSTPKPSAPKPSAPKPSAPTPAAAAPEKPAPAQPQAKGKVEFIVATPEVPADIVIHNAVGQASEDGKDLLVYVGASWCAPCVRFKEAVAAGKMDKSLEGIRFLAFDADTDTDRLKKAGYSWTYVPLFVRPGVNGRSSGVQIAGVPDKEAGAGSLVPRVRKLLGRNP
ncbi:MAG: thioredoxin family protein [Myxococcales bacterium]|nr:thioredoxin family protein [Myxococcales bacterium]